METNTNTEAIRKPRWITLLIERDEEAGVDLIVEPWTETPPFGWMAGHRSISDEPPGKRSVDYFGRTSATAESCLDGLEDVPAMITVECYYGDSDIPECSRCLSDELPATTAAFDTDDDENDWAEADDEWDVEDDWDADTAWDDEDDD